jgi:hypothetical protein
MLSSFGSIVIDSDQAAICLGNLNGPAPPGDLILVTPGCDFDHRSSSQPCHTFVISLHHNHGGRNVRRG